MPDPPRPLSKSKRWNTKTKEVATGPRAPSGTAPGHGWGGSRGLPCRSSIGSAEGQPDRARNPEEDWPSLVAALEAPDVPEASAPPPPKRPSGISRLTKQQMEHRDDADQGPKGHGGQAKQSTDLQLVAEHDTLGRMVLGRMDNMEKSLGETVQKALEQALERLLEVALARVLSSRQDFLAASDPAACEEPMSFQPTAASHQPGDDATSVSPAITQAGFHAAQLMNIRNDVPTLDLTGMQGGSRAATPKNACGIPHDWHRQAHGMASVEALDMHPPITTFHGLVKGPGSKVMPEAPVFGNATAQVRFQPELDHQDLFPPHPRAPCRRHSHLGLNAAPMSSGGSSAFAPVLWPVWQDTDEQNETISQEGDETPLMDVARTQMSVAARLRAIDMDRTGSGTDWDQRASILKDSSCLQPLMMHPTSNMILVWLVLASLLISYDVMMIPMNNFPMPDSKVLDTISVVTTVYWTLDTMRSFLTGFEVGETVDLRPSSVAKHYVRSWFALDALTCTLDWGLLILGAGSMFNKFWRTSRALRAWRLLCLLRLVRIVKLADRLEGLVDRLQSVQAFIALKSLYVFIFIIFTCHYIACYWYATAGFWLEPGTSGRTWLREHHLENAELGEVYVISLHWALAQSGFAQSEVVPTNMLERVYASCASILWLIVVSVTINVFNMWLWHLREANRDQEVQKLNLRKYLEEHEISRGLTYRVLRSFRTKYPMHMRRVHEEDIEFLRDLPVALKVSLHSEMYMPVLRSHLFFRVVEHASEGLLVLVCHLAMQEHRYLAGEIVFQEGFVATQMLHLLIGALIYCPVSLSEETSRIQAGDWICENALWMRWVLCGRLVAETSSELFSVDVTRFHAIMHDAKRRGDAIDLLQRFAVSVWEHVNCTSPETDLWTDKGEMQRLVSEVVSE